MKKFLILSLIVTFVLITTPACKKFVWNPVGNWSLSVDLEGASSISTQNVTLTGNESGGTITGWGLYNPDGTAGTWTKTGDYTIQIKIEYKNTVILTFYYTLEITGTTTKSSPNSITLTGTLNTYTFFSGSSDRAVTITATKTSDLQ